MKRTKLTKGKHRKVRMGSPGTFTNPVLFHDSVTAALSKARNPVLSKDRTGLDYPILSLLKVRTGPRNWSRIWLLGQVPNIYS